MEKRIESCTVPALSWPRSRDVNQVTARITLVAHSLRIAFCPDLLSHSTLHSTPPLRHVNSGSVAASPEAVERPLLAHSRVQLKSCTSVQTTFHTPHPTRHAWLPSSALNYGHTPPVKVVNTRGAAGRLESPGNSALP